MATVVFLHGLNTYGDDLLHLGPFTFGLMHSRLEREFADRDVDFIPVTGLGFGSPEEQAERALAFLQDVGLGDIETELHLLGHSVGGLVARALAAKPEMRSRVKSILTMGTPHKGTHAALFGLEFEAKYPRLRSFFAACGYDTRKKSRIFEHFTPTAMEAFNERFPSLEGIREITLLCEVAREETCLPLQALHRSLHPPIENSLPKSDGFVHCSSQIRGEVLGPFCLDHLGELGFFFQATAAGRRKAEREFKKLVQSIYESVSLRDKPQDLAKAPQIQR